MSLDNNLRAAIARTLAEHVTSITSRRDDEPVDVCRFHRDLADDVVDCIEPEIEQQVKRLAAQIVNEDRLREDRVLVRLRKELTLRRSYSGDPDPGGTRMLETIIREYFDD